MPPHPSLHLRYTSLERSRMPNKLTTEKGVNGLTARDIKLVVEGGYNTVEAIAYTYVQTPNSK